MNGIPNALKQELLALIRKRRGLMQMPLQGDPPEDEWLAAAAFHYSIPLLEPHDITPEWLQIIKALNQNLEKSILREYVFVPITLHQNICQVITPNPWDPLLHEVVLSYFPQCTVVRCFLASPATMSHIFEQLGLEPFVTQTVSNDNPAKPLPNPKGIVARQESGQPPAASPDSPPKAQPSSQPAAAPSNTKNTRAPSETTNNPRPAAPFIPGNNPGKNIPSPPAPISTPIPSPPVVSSPAASPPNKPQANPQVQADYPLSMEDVQYLINSLVKEAVKILQKKTKSL